MRQHHNIPREERERAIEQRMAVDMMMTPWVWAMAPVWAWWTDPPSPPRWPAPDARRDSRMDDLGDARR